MGYGKVKIIYVTADGVEKVETDNYDTASDHNGIMWRLYELDPQTGIALMIPFNTLPSRVSRLILQGIWKQGENNASRKTESKNRLE